MPRAASATTAQGLSTHKTYIFTNAILTQPAVCPRRTDIEESQVLSRHATKVHVTSKSSGWPSRIPSMCIRQLSLPRCLTAFLFLNGDHHSTRNTRREHIGHFPLVTYGSPISHSQMREPCHDRWVIGPVLWCSSTAAGTGDMFGIEERLSIMNEVKLAFHKLGGIAVLQKLHEDCLLLSLELKRRKIEFVLIRKE